MTVTRTQDIWKQALLRVVVVSGPGILLGLLLYGQQIFVPDVRSFQFTISSITAGLAYAATKMQKRRDGMAALLAWYILLTALLPDKTWWLCLLNLAYIAGIACAIYIYDYFARKPLVAGPLSRIFLAGVSTGIMNGFIVIVLSLFSFKNAIANPARSLGWSYDNIQIGTFIGLAAGIGIEIARFITRRSSAIGSDDEEGRVNRGAGGV